MQESPIGEWVSALDYIEAMTKAEQENDRLRDALQKINQDVVDTIWRVTP